MATFNTNLVDSQQPFIMFDDQPFMPLTAWLDSPAGVGPNGGPNVTEADLDNDALYRNKPWLWNEYDWTQLLDHEDPNVHEDWAAGGNGIDMMHGEGANDVLYGGQGWGLNQSGVDGSTMTVRLKCNADTPGASFDLMDIDINAFDTGLIARYGPNAGEVVDPYDQETIIRIASQVDRDDAGDMLWGDGGSDTLFGENGMDFLDGGSGDDALFGGRHADTMYGGQTDQGQDDVDAVSGYDTMFGERGKDWMDGGDEFLGFFDGSCEFVTGDYMEGNQGCDTMFGGSGEDTMYGNACADDMYGEEDRDFMYGGKGSDYMEGGNENPWGQAYSYGTYGDYMEGNNGKDTMLGQDGADTMYGGEMNDNMFGGNDWDVMFGEHGHDYMEGNGNSDTMCGGDHNDTMYGGSAEEDNGQPDWSDSMAGGDGDDEMYGQEGHDYMLGGADNDYMSGGNHDDYMNGNTGSDTMYGDAGDDWMQGQSDSDFMHGGTENDTMFGDSGNDHMFGDAGNDYLLGGENADVIDGGTGNDVIWGGADDTPIGPDVGPPNDVTPAPDVLTGGEGDDTFIYDFAYNGDGSYTSFGNDGTDVITDFSKEGDENGMDTLVLCNFGVPIAEIEECLRPDDEGFGVQQQHIVANVTQPDLFGQSAIKVEDNGEFTTLFFDNTLTDDTQGGQVEQNGWIILADVTGGPGNTYEELSDLIDDGYDIQIYNTDASSVLDPDDPCWLPAPQDDINFCEFEYCPCGEGSVEPDQLT